ncbi:glyoxylase-like metal-dependent hydrolase (beta-lactamase superfamily II) [Bradyrhizobium sp. AZCC 1678]|uniref:N-acyl homoserine lactonase family protein n=1 Tax=Bradyrhizobium sp. AZCC 1678 TaxID=3117030 RepID=UPI002FF1034B
MRDDLPNPLRRLTVVSSEETPIPVALRPRRARAIRQSRRDRINGGEGERSELFELPCRRQAQPFPIDFGRIAGVNCQSRDTSGFRAINARQKIRPPREEHMLGRALGGIAAIAMSSWFSVAQAQDIKLYAFSSGALTIGKGILQNLAPVEPPIQIPVGFFVIKHPKGNVLFDTGNNDRIITDPSYWGASFNALKPVNTPDVAIDTQLGKIGLKPDDIKYVVVSHLHLDHGGNVGKFPNSTIVVQKDEIQNAFWPKAGTGGPYMIDDFLPLRAANKDYPNAVKMLQLEGDLDLFGDGTLMVKRWVAHTPGSQMMTVRLKNTGLIILTGDNVYFRENVEKNLPPNIVLAYNPSGILTAYEWIRHLMATEKADFFTAHDPDAFKALKKAPEFYD